MRLMACFFCKYKNYFGNRVYTGWLDIGKDSESKRYYFNDKGVMMADGWFKIDGKWYYFYEDGTLARNTKIGKYHVDENGVRISK